MATLVFLLLVMPAANASAGILEDGTLDLLVFLAGKTTALDFGFAGVGIKFTASEERGIEVNGEPTYLSATLGACKIPWVKDKLGCGEN